MDDEYAAANLSDAEFVAAAIARFLATIPPGQPLTAEQQARLARMQADHLRFSLRDNEDTTP